MIKTSIWKEKKGKKELSTPEVTKIIHGYLAEKTTPIEIAL